MILSYLYKETYFNTEPKILSVFSLSYVDHRSSHFFNVSRVVKIHVSFSKTTWNLNFVNLFLKCGNYHKSRFYEQF